MAAPPCGCSGRCFAITAPVPIAHRVRGPCPPVLGSPPASTRIPAALRSGITVLARQTPVPCAVLLERGREGGREGGASFLCAVLPLILVLALDLVVPLVLLALALIALLDELLFLCSVVERKLVPRLSYS